MAQLGARLDGIEEAVGSNPIGSTKILRVSLTNLSSFSVTGNFAPYSSMLTMMVSSIILTIAETRRYDFASNIAWVLRCSGESP